MKMKLLAACAALIVPSLATAAPMIRVLGSVGYDTNTPEKEEGATETNSYKGLGLAVGAQTSLVDMVPGLGLVGGVALKKGWQSYSLNDVTNATGGTSDVTVKYNPMFGGVEAGVEFGMIPLVTLQVVGGYDYGMGSTVEQIEKPSSGTETTTKTDVDSHSQYHVTGRALMTVFPMLSVGIEPTWYSGNIKVKGATETDKYQGWAIRGVTSFSL